MCNRNPDPDKLLRRMQLMSAKPHPEYLHSPSTSAALSGFRGPVPGEATCAKGESAPNLAESRRGEIARGIQE